MTTNGANLSGKRILVAEDDWFIAKSLVRDLRDASAVVVGPVPTVAEALASIAAEPLDGVVLDVKLRGEMAFPVADLLIKRGMPFALATGYDLDVLPGRYGHVPHCGKPVDAAALARALFPD